MEGGAYFLLCLWGFLTSGGGGAEGVFCLIGLS